MKNPSKKLGVIVSVDGDISQVGMYSMSNEAEYLWCGEILNGPKVGVFLTINQNNIKIIATVTTEKVIDQQHTVKSKEFDNRYKKDSINRVISLKTQGVMDRDKFEISSKYTPMIGNEVTLTTREELNIIYGINLDIPIIRIGESLLEGQPIELSIDRFFATHIGIFGNTGSGKSNTLHKLYLELFRSEFYNEIKKKSQFFVIDFNGEYLRDNSFGIGNCDKEIFKINTRKRGSGRKLPVKKEYLFDADILAILFDARPATQIPFLRKAINLWNDSKFNEDEFARFVVGIIKRILISGDAASSDAKDNWIDVARKTTEDLCIFNELNSLDYHSQNKAYMYVQNGEKEYINEKSDISDKAVSDLKINQIEELIASYFDNASEISKLKIHLEFQKVYQSAWKSTNIEHINPLFNRIDTAFSSLEKVVEITDDLNCYKTMNIISLVHSNQEVTRLIPMLLSKMIYDEQKSEVSGKEIFQTKHLIIDEAHNILNSEFCNTGDDWQDYRLSVFEEIIKEGRKFGFYLTLSSQRPADISATIMSQVHNYFIHRLVNEKDLRMLENTMPTLDKNSYMMIPKLGQGECIITGNAIKIPVLTKVEFEEINRPTSDDVILTKLWGKG